MNIKTSKPFWFSLWILCIILFAMVPCELVMLNLLVVKFVNIKWGEMMQWTSQDYIRGILRFKSLTAANHRPWEILPLDGKVTTNHKNQPDRLRLSQTNKQYYIYIQYQIKFLYCLQSKYYTNNHICNKQLLSYCCIVV